MSDCRLFFSAGNFLVELACLLACLHLLRSQQRFFVVRLFSGSLFSPIFQDFFRAGGNLNLHRKGEEKKENTCKFKRTNMNEQ